jgi:hypothetical protein
MKISWAAAENPLIHDVDFHAHRGLALAIEPLRGLDHECGAEFANCKTRNVRASSRRTPQGLPKLPRKHKA